VNETNTLLKTGEGPALRETELSELQAIVGGQLVAHQNFQPPVEFPFPDPWLAGQPRLSVPVSAMPWPTPWVVAGHQ